VALRLVLSVSREHELSTYANNLSKSLGSVFKFYRSLYKLPPISEASLNSADPPPSLDCLKAVRPTDSLIFIAHAANAVLNRLVQDHYRVVSRRMDIRPPFSEQEKVRSVAGLPHTKRFRRGAESNKLR
jgi:hypothetical protein